MFIRIKCFSKQGENGSITVPEYLLDKTICYNDFYGGYENE